MDYAKTRLLESMAAGNSTAYAKGIIEQPRLEDSWCKCMSFNVGPVFPSFVRVRASSPDK